MTAVKLEEEVIGWLCGAGEVALELDVYILAAESIDKRRIRPGREVDQPAGKFGELFGCSRAFAFGGAQLHSCYETAQILIAGSILGQQRIAPAIRTGDLRADVCVDAGLLRRLMKAHCARDIIAVEHRHARQFELRGHCGQLFWNRSPFEKTERRPCVQLDVALSHSCPPRTSAHRAGDRRDTAL